MTDPLVQKLRRLSRFLDKISDPSLKRIAARGVVGTYKDGSAISHAGDHVTGLQIVLSGAIRGTSTTHDGREHVVAMIEPGNFSGLFAAIDGLPNPHSHTAQGDTTVLNFSRADTLALINNEPEFREAILLIFCDRMRGSLLLLDEYVMSPPLERLASRLSSLVRHHGIDSGSGMKLDIAMSQSELGAMVGLSRQSTNKLLKVLEAHNIVHFRYGEIIIHNPALLKRIATGEVKLD